MSRLTRKQRLILTKGKVRMDKRRVFVLLEMFNFKGGKVQIIQFEGGFGDDIRFDGGWKGRGDLI